MRTRRNVAGFIAVAALGFGLLKGRMRRYVVADESMLPNLFPEDYLLTTRLTRRPGRGDVIVVRHPTNSNMEIVKRVVGLPGETLEVSAGQVHVDGGAVAEPWADGPTHPDGTWHLGPDDIFVLSDARSRTLDDSRTFGPIDASATLWKVVAVYWPLRHRRRF